MEQTPENVPTDPMMAKASHLLLVFVDEVADGGVEGAGDGDGRRGLGCTTSPPHRSHITPEPEHRFSESANNPQPQEL